MKSLSINNCTTRFYLDTRKEKHDGFPVMCRITINRKKAEFKVGFNSELKDWDEKIGKPKKSSVNSISRNSKIKDTQSSIENWVYDAERECKAITAIQLKDLLTGKTKQRHTLLSMCKWIIERYEKTKQAEESLNKLKQTLIYIEKFLTWDKKTDLLIENVNQQTVRDFQSYLENEVKYGRYSKKLAMNTIGKHLSRFGTFWKYGLNSDLVTKNIFNGFKIPKEKIKRQSLSLDEFKRLRDLDLSEFPEKERVRDTFMFCCYMGFRYSDSQKFKYSQLAVNRAQDNKASNMNGKTEKNGVEVRTPVVTGAIAILDKYKDFNFRVLEDCILPPLSNQHVNRTLKLLAEDAKIDPQIKLTFHLSRHTCAQLLTYAGVDERVVGSWLGHKSNSITSHYIFAYDEVLAKAAVQFENYLNS
jgi:site-specific recombinase XerD